MRAEVLARFQKPRRFRRHGDEDVWPVLCGRHTIEPDRRCVGKLGDLHPEGDRFYLTHPTDLNPPKGQESFIGSRYRLDEAGRYHLITRDPRRPVEAFGLPKGPRIFGGGIPYTPCIVVCPECDTPNRIVGPAELIELSRTAL